MGKKKEMVLPRIQGLFDSHTHIAADTFADDVSEILTRAKETGLEHILVIGSGFGIGGNRRALEFCYDHLETFPGLYASAGVHPHEAKEYDERTEPLLRELSLDARVVAIGECGLDYYHEHSPRDVQQRVLRAQIRLARELDLPLIIHDRDAHEDCARILEEENAYEVGGVYHCFSGDVELARRVSKMNFRISIPGVVTFPKADTLREVVQAMPIEQLMIETDCPFLAPQPRRGKRNEPAYVAWVAERIAEVKGRLSAEDVARITSLNARRLFHIGEEPAPRLAYAIRDSLYLNLTNRCTLACKFCGKFRDYTVKGHYLKLPAEPSVERLWEEIPQPIRYNEVVFCGYGEPTLRLDVILELGKRLKEHGVRTRLNTDGLANLVHDGDVTPELAEAIDTASVSLNAPDAAYYRKWCPSRYGEAAYPAVKEFIRRAREEGIEVVASAVALPDLDIDATRRVAEEELNVTFRLREYNNIG